MLTEPSSTLTSLILYADTSSILGKRHSTNSAALEWPSEMASAQTFGSGFETGNHRSSYSQICRTSRCFVMISGECILLEDLRYPHAHFFFIAVVLLVSTTVQECKTYRGTMQ